jgi:hypothetical protein
METISEAEIEAASQDGQQGNGFSGLAASVATEPSPDNGASGSGGTATPGRKPGRPPIHGLYSQAAGSDGKHPAKGNGQEELPPAQVETDLPLADLIPPDLFAAVIQETLTGAEAYAQSKIEIVALQAGLTQADIVPQLRQAHLSPAKKELIGRLTPAAAQELGLNIQNLSPCAIIGLLLAPTVFSASSAYLTLAKLAVQRQAQGLSTKTTGEKAGGNSKE